MPLALYFEKHGDSGGPRPPLVLVHGGAGSIATNWEYMMPALAADRLVIGVELQGHGHTPHADRPYTFENSADDIAVLVGDLGIPRVDILGFSNGGPTVLRFAQRHPALTRRCVIASGFMRRDGMIPGFWDNFDAPTADSMPDSLADAYRAINPDPADLQRMFDLDVAVMREFRDWTDAELAVLDAPILFVSGDHDIVLPEHTVWMASAVARGRALILPAAHGDFLGSVEAGEPDAVLTRACVDLIRRLLDEESVETARVG
ncbi:alpha/beta fold hydrolase [Gordonia sp. i37]|uniref:alpha/beta fold hydrolase n=1 Tax=Gordonia sp. i37 TaxID=1961707 RepID=UPI0009ACDB23|nr:alpha/beta fold hydrolase [Gordonia sp. i37]OPX15163.1 hydrolase [Gordonia sp. i37]